MDTRNRNDKILVKDVVRKDIHAVVLLIQASAEAIKHDHNSTSNTKRILTIKKMHLSSKDRPNNTRGQSPKFHFNITTNDSNNITKKITTTRSRAIKRSQASLTTLPNTNSNHAGVIRSSRHPDKFTNKSNKKLNATSRKLIK
jgi:hypothetical protein